MSKRWTEKEDEFIFAYYETVGPMIAAHDLKRSEAATTARYRHLKDTGAWNCLKTSQEAHRQYRKLAGFKTLEGFEDE